MRRRIGRGGLILASLAVAVGAVWIMRAGAIPVIPPREAWADVDWGFVAGYAAVWSTILVVRSMRWVWLLAPHARVSMRRVVLIGLVGLGALVVIPARLGEIVRPVLVRRYEKVSGWTAAGTVAAERIVDGLFLSCSLLVAMALAPVQQEQAGVGTYATASSTIATTVQVVFGVFAVGTLGIMFAYWKRTLAVRWVDALVGRVSPRLAATLTGVLDRLLGGLAFLPHRGYLAAFVGVTGMYWGLNALGMWLLAHGCGMPLTLAQAWVVLGLLALGILVPNAPGYFGVFQLSVLVGLSLYLAEDMITAHGTAFVVVLYTIQIGGTLMAAVVAWGWLTLRPGRVERVGSDADGGSSDAAILR